VYARAAQHENQTASIVVCARAPSYLDSAEPRRRASGLCITYVT
jgi:hypothetical protein